uniref:Sprouty related EVH1 domain containing 3 n=1 Tax=Paramormyrops kingsleyae TaxID=1676925 RepID=A0A3B3T9D7_9TELE
MERDVVRVRAVVMTRDDSSGGWVPLGGGGLSHVVICKGQSQDAKGHAKYFVRGERLRDRAPVLDCAVQRGLVYNKVNPIFHHWRVEERKFGLTFQSPADAVSFESGLRSVIDWMDRGTTSPVLRAPEQGVPDDEPKPSRTDSESSFNSRKETLPKPITIVTSESSSTFFVHPPVSEDLSYGMKHTVTAQTPAMVHIMPLQHQPSTTDASRNPAATQPATPSPLTPATPSPLTLATPSPLTPATPSPLTLATPSPLTPTTLPVTSSPLSAPPLPLLDHGDLKDLWGVRGYEDYRRAEMRRTAGEGGLSDKSELCAVHFEKDLARMAPPGPRMTLPARPPHRHPPPPAASIAVPSSAPQTMGAAAARMPLTQPCTACASGPACGAPRACSTIVPRTRRASSGSRARARSCRASGHTRRAVCVGWCCWRCRFSCPACAAICPCVPACAAASSAAAVAGSTRRCGDPGGGEERVWSWWAKGTIPSLKPVTPSVHRGFSKLPCTFSYSLTPLVCPTAFCANGDSA